MKPAALLRTRHFRPRRGVVGIWFELLMGGAQMASVGTVTYCWARGHAEWREAQKQLAASGYSMDAQEVAQGPVPDGENFGATPALKGLATRDEDQTEEIKGKLRRLENIDPIPGGAAKRHAAGRPEQSYEKPRDWKALRTWLAGPVMDWAVPEDEKDDVKAVLAALRDRDEPLMKELLSAARRPRAVLNPAESSRMRGMVSRKDPTPDILSAGTMMPLSRHLLVRLEAALASGDHNEVTELLPAVFAMIRLGCSDNSLLPILVGTTVERCLHSVLRRGIAAHQFTDADLAACQKFLSTLDTARMMNAAFNIEMAVGVRMIQMVTARDLGLTDFQGAARFIKSANARDAMLQLCVDGNCAYIVNAFLARAKFLEKADWPGAIEACRELDQSGEKMLWPDAFRLSLGRAHVMGFGAILPKFAQTEFQRRLYIAACALERRRLQGQELPDALPDGLLAKVPLDIDGQPIRYLPTPAGFVLWSVALNLKDDWAGGTPPEEAAQEESPAKLADWQVRVP